MIFDSGKHANVLISTVSQNNLQIYTHFFDKNVYFCIF